MDYTKKKITHLISKETQRIKRLRPHIKTIDFTYEQASRGTFLSKIKVKTNKKTIFLVKESRSIEELVKKTFDNLKRVLERKKYRKSARLHFDMEEAA